MTINFPNFLTNKSNLFVTLLYVKSIICLNVHRMTLFFIEGVPRNNCQTAIFYVSTNQKYRFILHIYKLV